jgi:DNA-directed RNA polymerase subunit K/omega
MTFRGEARGGFEFVRVSSLRAAQLIQGCTPRVSASVKATSTAMREVAAGKVDQLPRRPVINGRPATPALE